MSDTQAPSVEPRTWSTADWIALAAVTTLGAALRLIRLDLPKALVFDETYYAKDACWYVKASEEICERSAVDNEVHPPLGKWLTGLGIELTDFNSFGWRIASAVAGIATIVLLYLVARRILRSTLGATIAAGLLSVDFLHYVQSRIAMLEIFVPLFGIAAILFALYDRDRVRAALARRERPATLFRPWRIAAGAAAGGALASKWSGGLFVVAVIFLALVWAVAARREAGDGEGDDGARRGLLRRELPSIALWLVALPALVYLVSYIGRVEGELLALPWSEGSWWDAWWIEQRDSFRFHRDLEDAMHPYSSPPWSWLLLKRPVAYYFDSRPMPGGEGQFYSEIIALGSPFVWWASIAAVVYVAYDWVRARSIASPHGVILAGFCFTYLPWLAVDAVSERTAVFMFYLLPTIPFMCLALGWVATRLERSWEAYAVLGVFSLGTLFLFAFYHPLLAARPLPEPEWRQRIWFGRQGCASPTNETTTATNDAATTARTAARTTGDTETDDDGDRPPPGWCWF